jgi:hypothetical protein
MFRISAGLLCFLPLMLAVAAPPQSQSRADASAPGAPAVNCGDDTFEQYLRWHNDAAHRMPAIVSGEEKNGARPWLAARACPTDRFSSRREGDRS